MLEQMNRAVIRDTAFVAAKKKRNFERLAERYYGKLDVLAAWEDHSTPDMDYIRDLKRRVRGHKNDLTYRAGEPPK